MSSHTVYAKGCNDNRCNEYNRSEILDIVSGSYDFVFVVLGTLSEIPFLISKINAFIKGTLFFISDFILISEKKE